MTNFVQLHERAAKRRTAHFTQRGVAWVPEDDVVEHFDFHQLPGPHEVAGHFDVGLRWRRFPRWMIVLCGASVYVTYPRFQLRKQN